MHLCVDRFMDTNLLMVQRLVRKVATNGLTSEWHVAVTMLSLAVTINASYFPPMFSVVALVRLHRRKLAVGGAVLGGLYLLGRVAETQYVKYREAEHRRLRLRREDLYTARGHAHRVFPDAVARDCPPPGDHHLGAAAEVRHGAGGQAVAGSGSSWCPGEQEHRMH